jgi:hypothetical protein
MEDARVIARAVYGDEGGDGKTHVSSKKTKSHPGQARASLRKKLKKAQRRKGNQ